MGAIVVIPSQQFLVERIHENLRVGRLRKRRAEFHNIQMSSARSSLRRENRAGGEIGDLRADCGSCRGDCALDFLARQMFAEGREIIRRPSSHQQPRRLGIDESHSIAQKIGP
jgi:hypothetical protein